MDLQILISKKGTKVVTATSLHQALQLLDHHYATNVRKWLQDVYEFADGIRKPVKMQDYAPRKQQESPLIDDYYLSLELAKLITLHSNSKVKAKYAKWLLSMEEQPDRSELFDKEQITALMDLVRAMCSVSYQERCEQRHRRLYEERNGGSSTYWWRHRAEIMGYSTRELRELAQNSGKTFNGKTQRQLLMQVDPYEMIRVGVIDLFMAMGKNERYARSMGDLAKTLAAELQVEIYDDREAGNLFAPAPSAEPVHKIQKIEEALRMSA